MSRAGSTPARERNAATPTLGSCAAPSRLAAAQEDVSDSRLSRGASGSNIREGTASLAAAAPVPKLDPELLKLRGGSGAVTAAAGIFAKFAAAEAQRLAVPGLVNPNDRPMDDDEDL